MVRLVVLGILSALFFSSTFVLNRAMSLAGGHWAWTASLRFGYMLVFLVLILLITKGRKALGEVSAVFLQYWRFWVAAGSIGFGIFYALISFSAEYAAGWIVATTWQTTILATPIVLVFFGRRVPARGLLLTGLIFAGIVLVNIEHAGSTSPGIMLLSALPVLVAAFAYPLGNQLVWEARLGENPGSRRSAMPSWKILLRVFYCSHLARCHFGLGCFCSRPRRPHPAGSCSARPWWPCSRGSSPRLFSCMPGI